MHEPLHRMRLTYALLCPHSLSAQTGSPFTMFNFGGDMRMYLDPETGRIWAQNTSPPFGWVFLTELSPWEPGIPSLQHMPHTHHGQPLQATLATASPSISHQQEGVEPMVLSPSASPDPHHSTSHGIHNDELSSLHTRLAKVEKSISLLQNLLHELREEIDSLWIMRPREPTEIPPQFLSSMWKQ